MPRPAARKQSLTKRLVAELHRHPPTTNGTVWDADVAGLGLRHQQGRFTYVLRYRDRATGRGHQLTLGPSSIPLDQARDAARHHLGAVAMAQNPVIARRTSRQVARTAATVPTLYELALRFLEQRQSITKPKTLTEYARQVEQRLADSPLGRALAPEVTAVQVEQVLHAMRTAPYAANRLRALLHAVYELGRRDGVVTHNPVEFTTRYREQRRTRYLTEAEYARLDAALSEEAATARRAPVVYACLRFLALTGLRKENARTLRWAEVDMDAGVLRLADTKTGAVVIPVGTVAVALLRDQASRGTSPYVFPSPFDAEAPCGALVDAWREVRARAGLDEVRLHDLRHAVGSMYLTLGTPEAMASVALGHKDRASTRRYQHARDEQTRAAAELVTDHIAAAMAQSAPKVLPFRRVSPA